MAGYIITFRFAENETSNTRRQNFYDFVKDSNIEIEEQTTSTIICKTETPLCNTEENGFVNKLLKENQTRPNNNKILISEDNILFVRIKNNKMLGLWRVKNLKIEEPTKIKQIFGS